jgi:hypothetical protein
MWSFAELNKDNLEVKIKIGYKKSLGDGEL